MNLSLSLLFLVGVSLIILDSKAQTTTSDSVTAEGCGQTKVCMHSPINCTSPNCTALATWRRSTVEGFVDFELMGKSDGWVALGLSNNTLMGDDSVIHCVVNSSNNNAAQAAYSYNYKTEADLYNGPIPAVEVSTTLVNTSATYTNGEIHCRFSRRIEADGTKVFTLNSSYYLFLGYGPASNGVINMHYKFPLVSSSTINIIQTSSDLSSINSLTTSSSQSTSGDESGKNENSFSDGVGGMVTYQETSDGSQVVFTLTRSLQESSGWVAVGLSTDQTMGNDSVIDCIRLADGSYLTQMSYNGVHMNDVLNPPTIGITRASATFENGTLKCVVTRQVKVNNARVFNLDNQYYLLLAQGLVDANGVKQYHSNRVFSADPVDVRFSPDSVQPDEGSTTWSTRSITTKDTGTVNTGTMNTGTKNTGTVNTGTMNTGTSSKTTVSSGTRSNTGTNAGSTGITAATTTVTSGTKSVTGGNTGTGIATTVSSGTRINAGTTTGSGTRISTGTNSGTSSMTSASSGTQIINVSGTGSGSKTTIGSGTGIIGGGGTGDNNGGAGANNTSGGGTENTITDGEGATVTYHVTSDGSQIVYTLRRPLQQSSGWVAVGFSTDKTMTNDSVIDCIRKSDGTFLVQSSYNGFQVNEVVDPPSTGIVNYTATFENGTLKCVVTRQVKVNNARVFDLDQQYHLLLAQGSVDSNGVKQYHSSRVVSENAVDMRVNSNDIQSDGGGRCDVCLKRAHGILMITAWVLIVSTSIIIARYYKSAWPGKKLCNIDVWATLHRALMVLALACTVAGFIIIFIVNNGQLSNYTSDMPSYFWVHAPLGIVVMILVIINPVMAIFRCQPYTQYRPIFNWLHWLVGTCCHVIALITILFGVKIGELNPPDRLCHYAVFWILIAFIAFHVLVEILLSIDKCITEVKGRDSFMAQYESVKPGDPLKVFEPPGSHCSLIFRYIILVIYFLVVLTLWLAMVILIGSGNLGDS